LLSFVEQTADTLRATYNEEAFIDLLFANNLSMHSATLQKPAQKAICNLVLKDQESSLRMISQVESLIFKKVQTIPPHLLAQNISAESQLVLQIVSDQLKLSEEGKPNFLLRTFQGFWALFFRSLSLSKTNAALANQVIRRFLNKVRQVLDEKQQEKNRFRERLLSYLTSMFVDKRDQETLDFFTMEVENHSGGNNFLVQNLISPSSSGVREEAVRIVQHLIEN